MATEIYTVIKYIHVLYIQLYTEYLFILQILIEGLLPASLCFEQK